MPGRDLRCLLLARRFLWPVLALLLAAPPVSADSWYEHYARAEQAMAREDWEEAIQQLLEAVERKGDSGARVRSYGMKVIPYFPHLKLGIAYYNLGDFGAALMAFQTESQVGAIQESDDDLQMLERYRRLALQAKEEAEGSEQRQIEQIVSDSLREARILQQRGRLQEAMDVLYQALAVDNDNAEATALMEQLRAEETQAARQRQEEKRATQLIQHGNALLAQGRFSEAASLFQQSLSIRQSAEAQLRLKQAQAALTASLQAERDAAERRALISDGLRQAQELSEVGRLTEAIDTLQPVLAIDPTNRTAKALQDRVLAAQQEAARQQELAGILAQAESLLAESSYEDAISAANRARSIDANNPTATKYINQAYRGIMLRLLGSRAGKPRENLPPAISFVDFRQEQQDGSRLQVVDSPDFLLSCIALDSAPVTLEVVDQDDREMTGVTTHSRPVGDEHFLTELNLRHRLEAGRSTFRVVATDPEGLSVGGEYSVFYRQPWFRSLWFVTAVAVVPVVAAGGAMASRVRRRRRLLRRKYNPYIAGAPVLDEDLFFGREPLLDKILQTIHNNSLLLYGERRIGKTSLQHHLKRRLQLLDDPEYDFFPVYVDLQGTPQERFFPTVAEDIFHDLEPVLDGLQPSAVLDSGYGFRELTRDLRRILRRLEKISSKKKKLVLLIDEVDELNDYDPRINQKLRSLFMKSFAESLVSVVSGVEIRKQWEKEGSPWYNFFEEVEVTAIGRHDAEELIRRPIQGVFKITDELIDRIVELSECKPYLIQKHCIALVNRMHEENRTVITAADIEAIGPIEAV